MDRFGLSHNNLTRSLIAIVWRRISVLFSAVTRIAQSVPSHSLHAELLHPAGDPEKVKGQRSEPPSCLVVSVTYVSSPVFEEIENLSIFITIYILICPLPVTEMSYPCLLDKEQELFNLAHTRETPLNEYFSGMGFLPFKFHYRSGRQIA